MSRPLYKRCPTKSIPQRPYKGLPMSKTIPPHGKNRPIYTLPYAKPKIPLKGLRLFRTRKSRSPTSPSTTKKKSQNNTTNTKVNKVRLKTRRRMRKSKYTPTRLTNTLFLHHYPLPYQNKRPKEHNRSPSKVNKGHNTK